MRDARIRAIWAILALCACGAPEVPNEPAPTTEGPGPRPPVVLITIESLRTDHVGAYGGSSRTQPAVAITPTLDALAREAVVYERAHSVTSWTLSSHASLFTGLYPTAHQTRQPMARLGADYTTLAERLSEVGYQTAAVVSGPYLRNAYNLTQGFDRVDESSANPIQPRAHQDITNPGMEAGLIRFIERERDPDRPFFLFAYFWDPHFDFLPPEPYASMFLDDDSEQIDVRNFDTGNAIHPGISTAELEFVIAQYDGEIRATDELLGRFFGLLRQRGLWSDSLVIVTADHGEEFFDHGEKGHKKNLHAETVRVPLLVKYPKGRGGRPGSRDERLVSLVDVAPTVLEFAGAAPAEPVHGRSLLSEPDADRAIFFELLSSWYVRRAGKTIAEIEDWSGIRVGDRKLLKHRGKISYFDLATDPTEQNDLSAQRREDVEVLSALLADQRQQSVQDAARFEHGGTADLEAEATEQLCALGYLRCPDSESSD
ncbi:MAG: sulfatase [Myxococcota bacterium]|nr:sulfatase [Myxococcota bacterium]